MKQHLTPELFNELKSLQTKSGFTLERAVESGLKNPDSSVGIYAGDGESYQTFAKIFRPVIETCHGVSIDGIHPSDLSPMDDAPPPPFNHKILSYRIRIARNIADIPFPPHVGNADRSRVEQLAVDALLKFEGDLKGRYFPLGELTKTQRMTFEHEHLLFGRGDRFMEAAGINRSWPASRGIFVSNDHKFAVWINEEDHLRIISMDRPQKTPSQGIEKTYNRLARAMADLEQSLTFACDPHLGFLTSCPSNLGTGMRAGVHVRLSGFKTRGQAIHEAAARYLLQIRGTHGEKTGVENDVVDISNRYRLGITEKKCVEMLQHGLEAIMTDERFS
ncbi:phosphagen kinase [Desulforapulum autotrophicum]|nr:phosphagen kinase [Desulforapulum autotrophicum]